MGVDRGSGIRLAWAGAVLLGIAFGLHTIADPDLFQQVAVGRGILEDFSSIGVSTFIEGHPDHPFVADKWLASVLVALADRFGGGHGLMVYQVLLNVLLAAAWMNLYRAAGGSAGAALAGTALTFVACAFRTDPRPDTLSLALLGWTASLFVGMVPHRTLRWILPLTLALWVNLHGYFICGLLIALAATAAAILGDTRWRPARAGLVLALSTAACCIHPQGWAALVWPLRQLVLLLGEGSPLKEAILEFQPATVLLEGMGTGRWMLLAATSVILVLLPLHRSGRRPSVRMVVGLAAAAPWLVLPPVGLAQWPYRMTVALLVMALPQAVPSIRGRRIMEVILLFGFMVLAIPVLRNLSLVPPAALLLLVPLWTEGAGEFEGRGRQVLAAAAAVLVIATVWGRVSDRFPTGHYRSPGWTGWGVDREILPAGAADFVDSRSLPGPVLNHFDNGGYLLYRWHPGRRVFIAGNTSMYPAEHLETYRREIIGGGATLADTVRRYGFRTAVISHAALETAGLVQSLSEDPDWRLVFLDGAAAVYTHRGSDAGASVPSVDVERRLEQLRGGPVRSSPLPAWLLPRSRIYPTMNLAIFLRNAGRSDLALMEVTTLRPLGSTPEMAALAAGAAEDVGRLPEIVPWLEETLERYPVSELTATWLSRSLYMRAVQRLGLGNAVAAEEDLRRAVDLTPGEAGPYLLLARIVAQRGDRKLAERLLGEAFRRARGSGLEEAVRRDPVLAPLLQSP